jgi:hypothetical protein
MNKRFRKQTGQSQMDKAETQLTLDARYRMKT